MPGTTDGGPVFVIWRSADAVTSTVTVWLLLAGTGSVVPAGAATVAVLACGPIAELAISVVASKVALPPDRRVTVVAIAPTPEAAAHDEPAVAVHVQVTPVNAAAKVSVTGASVAVLGPALVTAIIQVSGAPAVTVAALGVLVIARSAMSCGVVDGGRAVVQRVRIDRRAVLARRGVGHRAERRHAAGDRQHLGPGRGHRRRPSTAR